MSEYIQGTQSRDVGNKMLLKWLEVCKYILGLSCNQGSSLKKKNSPQRAATLIS